MESSSPLSRQRHRGLIEYVTAHLGLTVPGCVVLGDVAHLEVVCTRSQDGFGIKWPQYRTGSAAETAFRQSLRTGRPHAETFSAVS